MEKTCTKCRKMLSFSCFKKKANCPFGLYSHCKSCEKEFALQSKFNISQQDYNVLLEKQNHSCAICGGDNSHFGHSLCVDHDHETQIIRGLLCQDCNMGLGKLGDSVERLKNALAYLRGIK